MMPVRLLRSWFGPQRRVGVVEDGGQPERTMSYRGLRLPRLRGGAGEDDGVLFVLVGFFSLIIGFRVLFLGQLEPNTYGIMQNYWTGRIHSDFHRGGMFVTGPVVGLVKFPATQLTLEFSSRYGADRGVVLTRTGADPEDPDSGGQPISLTVALQYKFVPQYLREVYLSYGGYEGARERYVLLSGAMVSNAAQEWTPQDFWQRRNEIAAHMLQNVNNTLWSQGRVVATGFQIMKVDFAEKFEDSITAVQVAEQQKVVNEYQQQVQQVTNSIIVMKSVNEAHIANISAGADAMSKKICAGAKRDAFNLKQATKSRMYSQLKATLGFAGEDISKYFKIKAMQGQEKSGKLVIGLPGITRTTPPS